MLKFRTSLVILSLLIISGGCIASPGTSPSATHRYPDGPPTQDRTAVVEFVTEYEEAYAWENRGRFGGDITDLSLEQNVVNVTDTATGFVVRLEITARTENDGGIGEGDLPYEAIYRVTETKLIRADNLQDYSEPVDLADGSIVERWNGNSSNSQ